MTKEVISITKEAQTVVVEKPVERVLKVSSPGPAGPTGATGATGPIGPVGATGNTGDTGVQISGTAPVNTAVLWADTSDPGDQVIPAGGTTGQALVKASNTDYDTTWAGRTKLVQESNTQVSVVNTAAETNLFSVSQAAAANTSLYRITMMCSYVNNASGTFTFRLKIGATTIFSDSVNVGGNSATARKLRIAADVQMVGSRTSQKCIIATQVTDASAGIGSTISPVSQTRVGINTATEDLTTAKTWAATIQMSAASASLSFNMEAFNIEEITE